MHRILALAATIMLAACSTTGSIAYAPDGSPAPGPRDTVSGVVVIDHRDEKPNRLATVRGGFGNPAGVLDTPVPVADLVRVVFTDALQRRQMLSPAGPYRFQVTVDTLYADEYMAAKAELKMTLVVYDRADRAVYTDIAADRYDAAFKLSLDGTSARVEKLRQYVEALLSRNVDRMLSKPGLNAVLTGSRTSPG